MSPPTATAYRDVDRGRRALLGSDWFAAVAAAVVAIALGWLLIDEPARVDLEVVNPTGREVGIEVREDGDSSWRRVATLDPESERTVRDLLDRGETWTFRFEEWGRPLSQIDVERAALAATGWRLQIPAPVSDTDR